MTDPSIRAEKVKDDHRILLCQTVQKFKDCCGGPQGLSLDHTNIKYKVKDLQSNNKKTYPMRTEDKTQERHLSRV